MDALFQNAVQQAEALKRQPHSIPWKDDQPFAQSVYAWNNETQEWQPSTWHSTNSLTPGNISTIAVYSWNIDFMLPCADARMNAALSHLQDLIASQPTDAAAAVINLQECVSSDLLTIAQRPWIRERFYITDLDTSSWASGLYGTTTLVDRRLDVAACFRVHYAKTRMERDALFVDVAVPETKKKLRICNTHLESLALDPPFRPAQMKVIAGHMHATDDGLAGAVVTGDFNAIQPFDHALHVDNGLKDAYLELGGAENSEQGYTWGQQALRELRERFGCSRMDKAYYCSGSGSGSGSGGGLSLVGFERFGADVEIPAEEKEGREQLLKLGFERAWITDHLGIKAVFKIGDDVRL